MAEASHRTNPSESPLSLPQGAFSLRAFRPRDVGRIAEIVAEGLREHYEPSLYSSLSQAWPQGFLVAVDPAGVPRGFLLGVNQVPEEGRILMFAVDRDWRQRGLGSALMSRFIELCRERGLRRVTLEVRVGNVNAIRFYTRFGFSVTDLLPSYYSDGENGYQMTRAV
jgi:ribosomal-protein-alanine N-acetyltransferase